MSESETGKHEVGNGVMDTPRPRTHQDFFLQELVRYANDWGVNSSVTLSLGGILVSGQLCSIDAYFDGIAAGFKAGFKGGELGQNFFELISAYKPKKRDPDDENFGPPAHYIHLQDVRIYAPGALNGAINSKLWRGRISEVGGFIMGEPDKNAK